jgi:hypothetical protein
MTPAEASRCPRGHAGESGGEQTGDQCGHRGIPRGLSLLLRQLLPFLVREGNRHGTSPVDGPLLGSFYEAIGHDWHAGYVRKVL